MTNSNATGRIYTDGLTAIDRRPEWLPPFTGGWDWYQFSDGEYSTRWLADHPAKGPASYPEGTIFLCTHCGRETTNMYDIRGHNRVAT